jgi:peroxiredoxin
MMKLRLREYVVICSAVIITALCWWRISASSPSAAAATALVPMDMRPAPPFELYDQQSHLVKLNAFLNRHTVLLIFFDASQDPEQVKSLVRLREFYPALKSNGVAVFGISSALPQDIRRQSSKPFPFPILADIKAGQPDSASQLWGRCSSPGPDGRVTIHEGMFLVDRSGMVEWHDQAPQPVTNPEQTINQLISGN